MRCANIEECFGEIRAYLERERTGYFLLVNTENYNIYQSVLQRLETAHKNRCIYASGNSYPNGLPDIDKLLRKVSAEGIHVGVGLSQALMLKDANELETKLDIVLEQPVHGYGILLLEHCETVLQKLIRKDFRLERRIILIDGKPSPLPRVKMVRSETDCVGFQPYPDFSRLLAWMERLSADRLRRQPVAVVVSPFSPAVFARSVLSITESAGVYDALTERYADIAGGTEQSYGANAQWVWLAEKMEPFSSFSALICDMFGSTANLSAHLPDLMESGSGQKKWLLWLAMKVFGEKNHAYLTLVLKNSRKAAELEEHIHLDLAEVPVSDPAFPRLYAERRRLLAKLPENLSMIAKYCERLGKYQKDEVFYLTDSSDQERYEFVRCLSIYDYTEKELRAAVRSMSPMLALYMQDFVFDTVNTKIPEADAAFRAELTSYFKAYKLQKLTNRIAPEFLETVEQYAHSRPYNKLQPRSSIISHMDRKDAQLFFFDALGVEYLAFIRAKCEEYGMVSEIAAGRCELPSITEKNKEFLQYFPEPNCRKIGDLDEMKHHSQVYDYQICEYPLHLFEELEVIDKELRSIHSMLVQGTLKRAVIVSDHGASRLAVRYGHETDANIQLEEPGIHSGRCCPVVQDPDLPFAAYEDGFSVLANYERFRGGRKANVEVHGGASLEEVVVPVITLTKRPDNIEICFIDPIIKLVPRTVPELMLYSNIPLEQPRLYFEGEFYDGEFVGDQKHVCFLLPKVRRKGTYIADVYNGSKDMSVSLEFKAQKQTREIDLLNL